MIFVFCLTRTHVRVRVKLTLVRLFFSVFFRNLSLLNLRIKRSHLATLFGIVHFILQISFFLGISYTTFSWVRWALLDGPKFNNGGISYTNFINHNQVLVVSIGVSKLC